MVDQVHMGLNGSRVGRSLMVLLVFCAMFLLTGCGDSWSWHQKITVTVETPDGEKSGHSVQQARLGKTLHLGSGGSAATFSRQGEAVTVELGPQRFLFLLIAKGDNLAQYSVLGLDKRGTPLEVRGKALQEIGLKGEIPPKHYPLLVTFDDITKPETVRQVLGWFNDGTTLKKLWPELSSSQRDLLSTAAWQKGNLR